MEKEVLVRVKGLFTISGGDPDAEDVEMIAPGRYYEKNGKRYVLFDEHLEDFSLPTHNTLKLDGDRVSLVKRGLINTDLVFLPGSETLCHYTMPFGSFVLGLRTGNLQIREMQGELSIDIGYKLSIDYSHVSDCDLSIRILEKAAAAFSLNQ